MKLFLGIDPGRQGGWGIVDEDGAALHVEPLPYTQNQLDILTLNKHLLSAEFLFTNDTTAVIEHPLTLSGESPSGHLNSGKNFGILLALCTLHRFVIHTPQPGAWKSKMRLGSDKGLSMKLCDQLFPTMHDMIRGPRGGALDGLAEALLIAEYQRRIDGRRRGLRFDEIPSTGKPVRQDKNTRPEGMDFEKWMETA